MESFGKIMREVGADWVPPEPEVDPAQPEHAVPEQGPPIGLPDEEITTWVDTSAYGGQKFDALAAHASQSENIFFLRLGRDRFTELMGTETFVRVHDSTGAPTPEDDLFAGLR